ncbi:hypothetical protein E2P81_ATG02417 [Venturia nashicola]|uniref:Uncharacterized protein n=1 Tax=Venturia nashicola TaxID=86259 RepID=A0A4Z1PFK1_9PEZI|nr:hypothetical protein E6O75_ATG02476 [Venturia nashicola]TLD36635.1 hypothetical protein E2P81_ATG02417 [Venturia nashicola]
MDFRVPALNHRPAFSRQRSNSVPVQFSLVNVSDEEASVLFSAAERAMARRRRPVSVDSPGPIINNTHDRADVPKRAFNFSTPSRFGIGKSPLRHAVARISMDDAVKAEKENDNLDVMLQHECEETPSYEVEPAPIPSRELLCTSRELLCTSSMVSVRPPSSSSTTSSQDPISPRRQVAGPNLKAYADGLLLFTQSRLNNVAPQVVYSSGHRSDSSVPPTPDLIHEYEQDVMELSFERPALRSHFSNWSSTTDETVEDDDDAASRRMSFASSIEPRTPDEEFDMISPDSFFNEEATPRVRQTAEWTSVSPARPSSQIVTTANLRHSYLSSSSSIMNDPSSESFSYFTGFDSVSAAASSQFSASPFDHQILQTPPTPSGIPSRMQSRPSSSASSLTPLSYESRRRSRTPMGAAMDLSRSPSWLVRAVH